MKQTPKPENIPAADEEAGSAAAITTIVEQHPSEGGSYIRNADGSLSRNQQEA